MTLRLGQNKRSMGTAKEFTPYDSKEGREFLEGLHLGRALFLIPRKESRLLFVSFIKSMLQRAPFAVLLLHRNRLKVLFA